MIQVHHSKFKKKKNRKTRSDAGKPKKSILTSLCGVAPNHPLFVMQSIENGKDMSCNLYNNEESKESENSILEKDIFKSCESTPEIDNNVVVLKCNILQSDNISTFDNSMRDFEVKTKNV